MWGDMALSLRMHAEHVHKVHAPQGRTLGEGPWEEGYG